MKLKSTLAGFSAIVLLALGASARAGNLVLDGSFENTTLTDTGYFNQFSPAYGGTGLSGNFVAEDGNATLNTSFSQQISGLNPGDTYLLSFYQAASQQQGMSGATTEQWQVSFGSQTQDSTLMDNPSQSFTPWNLQTMTFTATAASEALTFLAIGTPAAVRRHRRNHA